MNDVASRIKTLIGDSGKPIKQVATDAQVSYFKLQRFVNGRTFNLDIRMAEKLWVSLTGERLLP